ncbi:hypothetical protein [Sphingomonas yabuuchiae]|uniref:hypothetical protein n=1 Tax=Sphingomonas yabuuchiae TaxID=172044 RepID=UPI0025E41F72|nr:hypothetical protein [uncultured Sphingomonas sp.]
MDVMRARFRHFESRRMELEQRAASREGMLSRSEWWRHEYATNPYLLGCPDDRLAVRFHDVFINNTELNREGKIGLIPVLGEHGFMRKFTHLTEEYSLRGGLPDLEMARKPVVDYFADGGPIAERIFAGYVEPPRPFLVKYGSAEFLEPMLREGSLRVCPAGYYSDAGHNAAIRDDEISRTFFIPTWRARLDGKTFSDVRGHRMQFNDDDIVLPLEFPDYYFTSLCDHIYYRMPTDFGADAALVIREPVRFTQRVISAFLARYPDWEPMAGPVTYYDPYLDYTKFKVPEMAKHFGYAYQREVRIAFRPKRLVMHKLEPIVINIGPMDDYAELLKA